VKPFLCVMFLGSIASALTGCHAQVVRDSPTPEEFGCRFLEGKVVASMTASPLVEGAPEVVANRRYDVTLVDVPGGKGGSVVFKVGDSPPAYVLMSADVPLSISDGPNPPRPSTGAASVSGCPELKADHMFVPSADRMTLTFGPTSLSSVIVVVTHGQYMHVH